MIYLQAQPIIVKCDKCGMYGEHNYDDPPEVVMRKLEIDGWTFSNEAGSVLCYKCSPDETEEEYMERVKPFDYVQEERD